MGLLNVLSKFGKTATATNRSASNSRGKTVYADSSTVSSDEVPYYREDSYYTLYSYPDSMMQTKVITFEERKGTAMPSARGLYPAQIMLLSYCETGRYPKPNGGYPGFWWFEYGIRDVGHALENLAANGFLEWVPKAHSLSSLKVAELRGILENSGLPTTGKKADLVDRIVSNIPEDQICIPSYTPKYQLTELGRDELEANGYVPYMHKHDRKTIEHTTSDREFNVWSVNRLFPDGNARNWKKVVGNLELERFDMNMAKHDAEPPKSLTKEDIVQFLRQHKDYIEQQISADADGLDAELNGIALKKAGRDDEALVQFCIAAGRGFDAPALYKEAAILFHKYKMYDEEIRILKLGVKNVPKLNEKHWQDLNTRLEKAKELVSN